MAAELEDGNAATTMEVTRKRKSKHKQGKKQQQLKRNKAMAAPKVKKPSLKMQKLFRKRVRDYDSDEDDDDDEEEMEGSSEEGEDVEGDDEMGLDNEIDEDDDDVDGDGDGGSKKRKITRFLEGSSAFRVAFMKIMKINVPNDSLGPILASHRKLVAQKLAEEEAEHHSKGEKRKERQLAAEKGHVKPPANFLDTKEKNLISVATKGVVKLFNAVSKAQNPQTGLNPSSSKDAKALAKRRKESFFSELQKPTTKAVSIGGNDEPGWAPLRDSYMLATKLKDWDKMPVPDATVNQDEASVENSSDEE